jgi:hypothetical protein
MVYDIDRVHMSPPAVWQGNGLRIESVFRSLGIANTQYTSAWIQLPGVKYYTGVGVNHNQLRLSDMGISAVLSVGKKEACVPIWNNIPVHASKILQTVSPFFRVKPPVGAVFEIF